MTTASNAASDNFYIYLPSNVKSATFDASNRISSYETKLETPITLDSRQYECGVSRLMITKTWISFTEAYFAYHSVQADMTMYSNLTEGHYETIDEVIANIKDVMDADAQYYVFTVDARAQRLEVDMKNEKCFLHFSPELSVMTGFKDRIAGKKQTVAPSPFDVTVGMPFIYLYSDVCSHSLCGESSLPLLATVEVQSNVAKNHVMIYNFPRVTYVPLDRDYVDTIRIQLSKPDGKLVPFSHGSVLVQLHVRRRKQQL